MPPTKLTLAVTTTAAVFALASPALADTRVSIEHGSLGNGLTGDYLFVRDAPSIFGDAPMDVTIEDAGTKIRITDLAGDMQAGSGCSRQGAAALCPDDVVGALVWGGNKGDVITNLTALDSEWDGDSGDDVLQGGPGDDLMSGGAGDDIVRGGAGRDVGTHNPGKDTFDGQADADKIDYSSANVGVTVTLGNASFDDGPVSDPDKVLSTENVTGSAQGDKITGSDLRNVIAGRAGADDIDAAGGDDLIDGEGGNDDVHGDAGNDTVTYEDRGGPVEVIVDNGSNDGQPNENDNVHSDVEVVEGTAFGDELTSIGGAHTLNGNGGNDRLDDGAGVDTLNGGPGDDRLIAGPGADVYDGGANTDTLDYSARTEPVHVTLDNSLTGNDGGASDGFADADRGIENVVTGTGNDTLIGSIQANDLTGNRGNDKFFAGDGNDIVRARDGEADEIDCGAFLFDEVDFDLKLDTVVDCEFLLGQSPLNRP